jgi:hypothetical protein
MLQARHPARAPRRVRLRVMARPQVKAPAQVMAPAQVKAQAQAIAQVRALAHALRHPAAGWRKPPAQTTLIQAARDNDRMQSRWIMIS